MRATIKTSRPAGRGLLNLGTFNLAGGTLGGTTLATSDFGAIMNAAGSVTAPLLNNGLLNVTGSLNAGAITNVGAMSFSGPGAVLRPQLLVNNGGITLNGGAIAGAGGALNTGLLSGSGAISVAFTNSGTLAVVPGTRA
jgi:hypothetical protein